MEDFDLQLVARKSIKGVFALVSRTFFIQLLALIANLILSVYLAPADLGVFVVVSSIVVFLNYFQDIGLAASLIQKKDTITREELTTTFTIQQTLVLCVVIPTLFFSRDLAHFYNLSDEGYYLLLSLVIGFFLSSLRTIPTILLERNLEFNKLVLPQIFESLSYFISLIFFVMMGYGIMSFTVAIVLRSVVGLLCTYYVQPWTPGFSFHKQTFYKLASYGLPFQANSFLALLKDDLLLVYVGKILPFTQVGYIGFGQKWAFYPLRLIMDNVIKITFPSFSRLQHDKDALKVAIEKSLFLIALFIFPTCVGMMLLFPEFIRLFPYHNYGEKWAPALFSLACFSLSTVFSSLSTPLTNFLNAIGKVKVTLYLMVFWTSATWILTPVAIAIYGYNGVALASLIISFSSIGVYYIVRRYVDFVFYRTVMSQFFAAIAMSIFIMATKSIVTSFSMVFIEGIFALGVYAIVMYLIARKQLHTTIVFIVNHIRQ